MEDCISSLDKLTWHLPHFWSLYLPREQPAPSRSFRKQSCAFPLSASILRVPDSSRTALPAGPPSAAHLVCIKAVDAERGRLTWLWGPLHVTHQPQVRPETALSFPQKFSVPHANDNKYECPPMLPALPLSLDMRQQRSADNFSLRTLFILA